MVSTKRVCVCRIWNFELAEFRELAGNECRFFGNFRGKAFCLWMKPWKPDFFLENAQTGGGNSGRGSSAMLHFLLGDAAWTRRLCTGSGWAFFVLGVGGCCVLGVLFV